MSFLDKLQIDKAKAFIGKNAPKIVEGVDKATDAIDKRTGGRFADQLAKVDAAAGKLAKSDAAPAAAPADAPADDAAASADDDAS